MKKNLTLLTGIVFLVAILVTCAGRAGSDLKDPKHVKIYLKAIELDGQMHLLMTDSNNDQDTVIDNLITEVERGGTVLWKKDAKTIKKLNQIRPVKNGGLWFGNANAIPGDNDSIQIDIPMNAEPGIVKYVIIFTDKDNIMWCIDPYLKIPRTE